MDLRENKKNRGELRIESWGNVVVHSELSGL